MNEEANTARFKNCMCAETHGNVQRHVAQGHAQCPCARRIDFCLIKFGASTFAGTLPSLAVIDRVDVVRTSELADLILEQKKNY